MPGFTDMYCWRALLSKAVTQKHGCHFDASAELVFTSKQRRGPLLNPSVLPPVAATAAWATRQGLSRGGVSVRQRETMSHTAKNKDAGRAYRVCWSHDRDRRIQTRAATRQQITLQQWQKEMSTKYREVSST